MYLVFSEEKPSTIMYSILFYAFYFKYYVLLFFPPTNLPYLKLREQIQLFIIRNPHAYLECMTVQNHTLLSSNKRNCFVS